MEPGMDDREASAESLVRRLVELPEDWHGAGSVSLGVLRAIARLTAPRAIRNSVETGSGKTTLLLSHLSDHHTVFAYDTGNSITNVRSSPLFRPETVTFIEGPSQRTLPLHQFENPLDLVMLDGPHGYPFPELEYWHLYPHLAVGGLLIIDDIHVPTCYNMFEILREEEMFRLLHVEANTAFFERTEAPLHDPFGCGWWQQNYNKKRFPIEINAGPSRPTGWQRARAWIPRPVRELAKALLRR
jgi:hypothetical protein